jgi:hypothetical protein
MGCNASKNVVVDTSKEVTVASEDKYEVNITQIYYSTVSFRQIIYKPN